jgi:hypothetical protein
VAGGPKGYPVKALVGSSFPEILGNKCTWEQVSRDNIDYYGMLTPGEACRVGDTVIFGYRSQVFITRAMVTIIAGVQSGKPEVVGIFDHAANMVDDQYDVIAAKQVIAKIESVIERY